MPNPDRKPPAPGASSSPKKRNKHTPSPLHKAEHDPRAAALAALTKVLSDGVDSQAALNDVLRSPRLMPTDKRLCTELTYGVLRWHLRLKWFVRRFLANSDKLPAEMFLSLLTAFYELRFLRIPHHATVNWTVDHVRNRFGQGMARVANGVLRSLQRSLRDFSDPALYAASFPDVNARLGCLYAVPAWLVSLWREQYGEEEALALLRAAGRPAPSGLRLNPQRPGWAEARAELMQTANEAAPRKDNAEWDKAAFGPAQVERPATQPVAEAASAALPASETHGEPHSAMPVYPVGNTALAFAGSLPWQARGLVQEGRATRQSAASYEALTALAPAQWPGPVWDCCAGRGGKTLALLEMGVPVTLATDPSEARLAALAGEYERLGLASPPCPACIAVAAEKLFVEGSTAENGKRLPTPPEGYGKGRSGEPAEMREDKEAETAPSTVAQTHANRFLDISAAFFGTVLVDAPCSGFGTLSRRPEIRLRRTKQDIAGLIEEQRAILKAAWDRLLPDGLLVYLTCTRNKAENEDQIAALLQAHPEAVLEREFRTPAESPLREFFYGAAVRKRG